MEYTVKALAHLAGISSRTLRYYDEIGLLKPARINSSGYRIYGVREVDLLQQILFFKELELPLEQIKEIIASSSFHSLPTLKNHREQLLEKRTRLDTLIQNINKTISKEEGKIMMNDKEKFEGFKKELVKENEQNYGHEIRQKYGDNTVERSNHLLLNMSQQDYDKMLKIEEEMRGLLVVAMEEGSPHSETAQKAAYLHKKWLSYHWGTYHAKAHAELAKMYVEDERFTAYYDGEVEGTAKFLRDAILIYTGMEKK